MLALVAFESTYNMALTSVSTTSRSSYLESIPAYRELVARNEEKDSDFYRYEKLSRVTKNDGALAGYPTASLFSSTSNAAVQDWYDRMGMSESKVFYCFDGQTPLSAALLNVRYLFSRSDAEDSSLYTLIDEQDGVYLYQNNYTLPAGFILQDGQDLSSSDFLKRPPTRSRYKIRWRLLFQPPIRSLFPSNQRNPAIRLSLMYTRRGITTLTVKAPKSIPFRSLPPASTKRIKSQI